MLRLWGRLSSINVRKVVWTAQELGITLQRTDAGGQYGIVRDAVVQWIRTPAGQRDDWLIAASVAATEPLMGLLDAHLARQPFMAGDRFTMADIPVACEIHRWWGLPQERVA